MSSDVLTKTILGKMPEVSKWQGVFLVHLLQLILSIPRRLNFSNLARYGSYNELTYRKQFERHFNWLTFNSNLVMGHTQKERIIVFDPTYLSKSGQHTPGVGYFWSGGAAKAKWGLEVGAFSAVDLHAHTAFHLLAEATPAEAAQVGGNLLGHYAHLVARHAPSLRPISSFLVVDAFFSRKPFIDPVVAAGFQVITRLRDDVALRYPCLAPQPKTAGRPPEFAGPVNVRQLDEQYFTPCLYDQVAGWIAYEARLYVRALKRWCKIVVLHHRDEQQRLKQVKIYCSTLDTLPGATLLAAYKARFQAEFLFRDAKQFTGLEHCQSRQAEALHFHVNASLTAVSLAKTAHWLTQPADERGAFSMSNIKTLYFNELLLHRFFDAYGLDPHQAKNHPAYFTLLNLGRIAA